MGWNKQSGERWELQRTTTIDTEAEPQRPVMMLQLHIKKGGLLTIEDAMKLCGALAAEVQAADMSEGRGVYGAAVLKYWDETLGPWEEPQPPVEYRVIYQCRKCGQPIDSGQYRFGSPETGWEHMEGECITDPTEVERVRTEQKPRIGDKPHPRMNPGLF